MDLEDRRIRREKPRILCHERKTARGGAYHRCRKAGSCKRKVKCPDEGTSKIVQKPARINPLMTVLMSARPRLDQPTGDGTGCSAQRRPLQATACRTVVLELPEDFRHEPAAKKSVPPAPRKSAATTRFPPDPRSDRLKLSLKW